MSCPRDELRLSQSRSGLQDVTLFRCDLCHYHLVSARVCHYYLLVPEFLPLLATGVRAQQVYARKSKHKDKRKHECNVYHFSNLKSQYLGIFFYNGQ